MSDSTKLERRLLKRMRQIEKRLDPEYPTVDADALAHLAHARRDLIRSRHGRR